MELEELKNRIDYSINKLDSQFEFLNEFSTEYIKREEYFYHIDIKFKTKIPYDFLLFYGIKQMNPFIGFDLHLKNEEGIKNTIATIFMQTRQMFETLKINLKNWEKHWNKNENPYIL